MNFLPIGYLAVLLCGCSAISDPGTIHRERPIEIEAIDLPQPVVDAIDADSDNYTIKRVQIWGRVPYRRYEVESEEDEVRYYNPDGTRNFRVPGGVL